MDDTSKYRDLFFDESDEYLQTLNDCLLELEKNPNDKNLLDEIFRAAHTLKGMAATMGYKTMTELTHGMESVLELFRAGSSGIDSDVISLIFKCLDKLSEIVEDLRIEKYIEYDITDLLNILDKVVKEGSGAKKSNEEIQLDILDVGISDTDKMVIQNAIAMNFTAYNITVKIANTSQLKGARAYLVVNKLGTHGDIIYSNPSTEELEKGNFGNIFKLIYLSKLDRENIRELIESTSEIEEVAIQEVDLENKAETKIETKAETETETTNKEDNNKTTAHHANQSIRVDLARLDSFMNLVSELVIYRTRLEDLSKQYNTTEINEPLEHVARITSELQDLVLNIRMQPVNVVFNRFPRMIRDLSNELNKEIELIIEGEETELDRTVVSELGEPLVHIMRNAADHGIDSVDERLALGKPRTGLVKLSAYQEGNRVVITVSDDGKGINPVAIKASAAKKGIDTTGMSDRDLVQLIFDQGFSTVEKVTDVSGRGVGMDVVRQKISSLGGDIQVMSEVNKGTTFVIKLPLTLSIIQALMVKIGSETFALPLGIIERVVKVRNEEIVKSHNNEVYIYRERAVPVVRLNEKLNIESVGDNKHIILVTLGDQYFALLVDDLIGQQEIVIKKLNGVLSRMKEYLGVTILGNGDITIILDIGSLCNQGKEDNIE